MTRALALEEIRKRFDDVLALDAVSVEFSAGEVHAVLGENGAGKSTLMHVAAGLLRPDGGRIVVNGGAERRRGFRSPAEARGAGIGLVHQHFTSIAAFTVAENIALAARWPETGRDAESRAREVIDRVGLPLDPARLASTLPVQLLQRLEIVKALASNAGIVLLDEPTALLAPAESADLLRFLRHLANRGAAVVLITHKLREVVAVADRVTVLRRGAVTWRGTKDDVDEKRLVRAMIGDATVDVMPGTAAHAGEPLVRVHHLNVTGTDGRRLIEDVSVEIRGGEVVGVAAVEGNGQRELLRVIAGVADATTVRGEVDVATPCAFIPEDREHEGLIPAMSLAENLLLGRLGSTPGWIDWGAVRDATAGLVAERDVRASGVDAPIRSLSGGNQQKLVVGRALLGRPRVVVAEEPTRGVDIRATAAIHAALGAAAASGSAVLVYSSDLDEVMAVANRIVVMRDGQLVEVNDLSDRDAIGEAMVRGIA